MPRARDPNRDKAHEIWKQHNGEKKLKDIAAELGVSDTQVRKWKSQDKWEHSKGNVTKRKRNVTEEDADTKVTVNHDEIENDELTEKQRLFCLYYIKSFNGTMAAIKAGYAADSAHVEASRQLRKAKVAEEIRRLKGQMRSELFVDAMDVLNKYIRIAFSDITDFVRFNEIESTAEETEKTFDSEGNVTSETVRTVPYTYTAFRMRQSDEVDGTLLTELSKGKDGMFKVKLADKMKALDKLAEYFDLFPDKFKRDIEQEKLKLAQQQANKSDNDKPIEILIKRKGDAS